MGKIKSILFNVIFCLQVLLTFFLLVGDRLSFPPWLQVAGRLHPMVLHLPIGLAIFFFLLVLIPKKHNLDHKTFETITFAVLLLTSLSASVTALCGFILSAQGDYGADSLAKHKFTSIFLSWLCYLILINYDRLKEKGKFFYGINALAFLALFYAGHTGATLTHGENFVFEPITHTEKKELSVEKSSVYQLTVEPILEKKCFSCHNESKAKGGLVMTSTTDFVKGGKHGKEWMEGKPEQSNLIKVIHLPITHDQHMPPDGKAQLTIAEMNVFEFWIQSGASFDVKMAALKPGDSLGIMAKVMASTKAPAEEKVYSFTAASESAIEKLDSPFRSVFPLYQNSPALRADFFVTGAFDIKALEELTEVQEQLVELNLSHMPIADKDLAIVARFKNLEKLNLNFTKVTSDLSALQSLQHLKSLSLSGDAIDARVISKMLALPALTELFAWNTPISTDDQVKLTNQHKNRFIVWNVFQDDKAIKLSMPAIANEGVLKKEEGLILKHVMPGASIHYTLDGSKPDSVNSAVYQHPIKLESATRLKARAYKDGWLGSEVYEAMCFVEGSKPQDVELLTTPDPQYPGEGSKSLMDGTKGAADQFKEPSWLGFRDNAFAAAFDFGKEPKEVKNIVISYGKNTGSYIFPPAEVQVWAGNSKGSMTLIKTVKVSQPTANESANVEALIIPLGSEQKEFFRVVAKPVNKLPSWHSGKGQKGWFFIDEIFFN